ncbi:KilA-N, DNA-binding domain protein [Candidatus Omnitrophus magneticus]|uniref:KilA-N, DNA-binding domain protein n=1 Tax=Candidatus Omnitrophus magneticus TaxID=1609969 RepID=A0A0F0CMK9_9BACT|nr:KilA-N, DNA-binding domain protein [Candidatus Omnitrophus magneticus]
MNKPKKESTDLSLVNDDKTQFKIDIKSKIFVFRDKQVMVDRDLAELYRVGTKRLNEQVKRNIERFPEEFRFQLSKNEKDELVANCDRFGSFKHSTTNPYVFTEQGVAMLSAVLHSKTAIDMSIKIIKTFVEMRKFIIKNVEIFQRLDKLELKQIEHINQSDKNFKILFDALENNSLKAKQGIFYDGQIFDAYQLISDIIRSAKKAIVLIDNYVDDSVLKLLSKRHKGVTAIIYSKNITETLKQDIEKYNSQYAEIVLKELKTAHDRFIIIDKKLVYHFGASLKDAGKKWFAFSRLSINAQEILDRL